MSRRGRGERGSASIYVLAAAALLVVVAGAVVMRGVAVIARHEAENAADLAALAAAGQIGVGPDPCAAARRIAAANGATLSDCSVDLGAGGRSGTVDVGVTRTVRLPVVGSRVIIATARAGRLPPGSRGQAASTAVWHAGSAGDPARERPRARPEGPALVLGP